MPAGVAADADPALIDPKLQTPEHRRRVTRLSGQLLVSASGRSNEKPRT